MLYDCQVKCRSESASSMQVRNLVSAASLLVAELDFHEVIRHEHLLSDGYFSG